MILFLINEYLIRTTSTDKKGYFEFKEIYKIQFILFNI